MRWGWRRDVTRRRRVVVQFRIARIGDIVWHITMLATWENSALVTKSAELGKFNIVAFVTIVDTERAKSFYRDTLGLRLVSEEPPFALVFDANGIMLRLGMGKEAAFKPRDCAGLASARHRSAVRDLVGAECGWNDTNS